MHDPTKLEEAKVPENLAKEDDFGLGMTQFLDYNKDDFDMLGRSRSHGNLKREFQSVPDRAQSINSDPKIIRKLSKK